MEATEDLKQDHRVIERVLAAVERLARQAGELRALKSDEAESALEFLRSFTDAYHHGKEEQHLFKVLEERGIARSSGLVAELLREHGEGRRQVRAMSEAVPGASRGDAEAARAFAQQAQDYVTLIRRHIEKEDRDLFPLADQVLAGYDDARLMQGYEQTERETIGEGGRERYRQRAEELAAGD